jgi:hypothetical protein
VKVDYSKMAEKAIKAEAASKAHQVRSKSKSVENG